ncbi:MAG: hypothetical protein ACN4GZ_07380, partial [Acidimicrobiales bacterium]
MIREEGLRAWRRTAYCIAIPLPGARLPDSPSQYYLWSTVRSTSHFLPFGGELQFSLGVRNQQVGGDQWQ